MNWSEHIDALVEAGVLLRNKFGGYEIPHIHAEIGLLDDAAQTLEFDALIEHAIMTRLSNAGCYWFKVPAGEFDEYWELHDSDGDTAIVEATLPELLVASLPLIKGA